jgi:hypothetical protein
MFEWSKLTEFPWGVAPAFCIPTSRIPMEFSDWGSRLFDIAGIHKLGTKKWFNSHSVTDGLEIVNFGCDSLFLICLGGRSLPVSVGGPTHHRQFRAVSGLRAFVARGRGAISFNLRGTDKETLENSQKQEL